MIFFDGNVNRIHSERPLEEVFMANPARGER